MGLHRVGYDWSDLAAAAAASSRVSWLLKIPAMHTQRVCMLRSFSRVRLFETPWTVAHQAPLSWDSQGKNTGVGFHAFLQGIFPTQGPNPRLLPHRRILGHWATGEAICTYSERERGLLWVLCLWLLLMFREGKNPSVSVALIPGTIPGAGVLSWCLWMSLSQ